MKRVTTMAVVSALMVGSAFTMPASAQSSGGQYTIKSVVIAGGGGSIAGGAYQITSTMGQAATSVLSGSSYVMFDGFWSPVGGGLGDIIFINGFEQP